MDNNKNGGLLSFEDIPSGKKEEHENIIQVEEKQIENPVNDSRRETGETKSGIERLREKNAAKEVVDRLIEDCRGESDYLALRDKIIGTEYQDMDKAVILQVLDDCMSQKLSEVIKEADQLESRKEEVKTGKHAIIFVLVVGVLLTTIFPLAFLISIVIAIACVIGIAEDRKSYKASKKAKNILNKYERAGYHLK